MTKTATAAPSDDGHRRARAARLGLHGLVARWDEVANEPWLDRVIDFEETERSNRGLLRRVRNARIGTFRAISDFDWSWPSKIDRFQIEDLLGLGFMSEGANAVLIGPNAVGKTTIAQNIAHQAVLRGHTVRFITASELLNDLAAQDSASALSRRLRRYCHPSLLVVDEVGYLSYDSRHGDLLFEVVSRRHGKKSVVLTTNKPFGEWNSVFPNSSSVTALIDRLIHKAEIVPIEGGSYRAKEAKERAESKARLRKAKTRKREEP